MNIQASIIEQRLLGIVEEIREEATLTFGNLDKDRLKSLAFIYLCVKTMLDMDFDEVMDNLVEGGGDFGVDAIRLSEEIDGEFHVTIFQCKYKSNLEGNSNFPENGINSLINAVNYLFDPSAIISESAVNKRLLHKIEAIRSMRRDGFIPKVHIVACNNGLKWNHASQEAIDRAKFGDQVNWEHVNHESLVHILQRSKPVDAKIRLTGKAIIEDMNFSRVCVGRVTLDEIASLMKTFGEQLLERNIRRYLGLHGNRVNEGIRDTINSDTPSNFYFFNNGLTLVCSDFSYKDN